MRRILSIFMVIAMLVTVMPSAFAEATTGSGSCGANATWVLDEGGTLTISGTGAMYDYGSVTCEYESLKGLVSRVVIEEGITRIGSCAFQYCSMYELELPSTLKSIGAFAFAKAENLSHIEYNGCSPEIIADEAFYGCWSLREFYIFDTNCSIGSTAFSEAYEGAICGYTNSTAEAYANTYGIPFHALNGTCGENLTWELDANGTLAIRGTGEMTQWGGSDNWMPWDCHATYIKNATIEDGVTSVSRYTFTCYENLETITIPASVDYFAEIAVHDCRGLKNIFVDAENKCYSDVDGVLLYKDNTILVQYPSGKEADTYVIPDMVTQIAEGAFAYDCNLKKIEIPASVYAITEGAFGISRSLEEISVDADNEYYSSDANGILFDKNQEVLVAYPANRTTENYTVPSTVKQIAVDAANSARIGSIDFSESQVETISSFAFANCWNLSSVTLPSTLKTIGSSAFGWCSALTSVKIPDGTTSIGREAFESCSNLSQVTIPASVTEIGAGAFADCSEDLILIVYAGSAAETYAIENGISYTALGEAVTPLTGYKVTVLYDDALCELSLTNYRSGDAVTNGGYIFDTTGEGNAYLVVEINNIAEGYRIKSCSRDGEDCSFVFIQGQYGGMATTVTEDTEIVIELEEIPETLPQITGVKFYGDYDLTEELTSNTITVDEDTIICAGVTYDSENIPEYYSGCYFEYSTDGSNWTELEAWGNRTDFWAGWPGHEFDFVNTKNYYLRAHLFGRDDYCDGDLYSEVLTVNPAETSGDTDTDTDTDTEGILPVELRFDDSTYINGSVRVLMTLMEYTGSGLVSNTHTYTITSTDAQRFDLPVTDSSEGTRYAVRIMFQGNNTNIHANQNYFYSEDGLTTEVIDRSVVTMPEEPLEIDVPLINTVRGKLILPEDYYCDEEGAITSLWVELYDTENNYLKFMQAEVDENLNYLVTLPSGLNGDYTISIHPEFTRTEDGNEYNPRTNLVLRYYDYLNGDGGKQYFTVSDGSPVYGVDFNLETGYVVSGTLNIPADAVMDNTELYMSVSGFDAANSEIIDGEGDYYFSIDSVPGQISYDWYFAVSRSTTDLIVGCWLNTDKADYNLPYSTNLVQGSSYYAEDSMTMEYEKAKTFSVTEDISEIPLELQTGVPFAITVNRPENITQSIYADLYFISPDGNRMTDDYFYLWSSDTAAVCERNIPCTYDEVYLCYANVDVSGLYEGMVFVNSDGSFSNSLAAAKPWQVTETSMEFTPVATDYFTADAPSEEDIAAFLEEVKAAVMSNSYELLADVMEDNTAILSAIGIDVAALRESSEEIQNKTYELLLYKIDVASLTAADFQEAFKEAFWLAKINCAESWTAMKETLYTFAYETGFLVDVIERIETLSSNLVQVYQEAYQMIEKVTSVAELEDLLYELYQKYRRNEASSGSDTSSGGGSSGGGGVSLTFHVLDSNDLTVITGAQIFVASEDGTETTSGISNSEGVAYLPVGEGVYSVQAIADGYQMRNFVVEKTEENYEFTVYMSRESILQVDTTVTEMDYDAIVDAGIDVDAVGNKQVYNCTAVLTFSPTETVTFDYICTDDAVLNAESVKVGNATICPVAKDIYLIIYSSTTWLKEMFDVQLLVTNTSAIETVENCAASLNLPEGLSLAVMTEESTQQSADVTIGDIAPNGNADIHWYVSGDAEGTYRIGGTVTGTRVGGGISENLSVNFSTRDKITVLGGSAMKLKIKAEKTATVGEPYRVEYTLQNVSNKTLYNVEMNILGGKFLKEYSVSDLTPPYGWEGSLENGYKISDSSLESGESLSGVFEITFAEGIEADAVEYTLTDMFAITGNGSTVTIPTEIELVDEVVSHNWDNGTVTKEATCETAGEKTYHCTDDGCDETKTEIIPAKVHDWDDGKVTTQPTETSEGEKTYSCANCDEVITETLPRLERQDVSFLVDEITYTYGDRSAIYHYAYNDTEDGGALTYSSSDESVASVDDRGKVTIHNAGEAIITATAAEVKGKYAETSASYKLVINKAALTITANSASIYYGEAPTNNGYTVEGLVYDDTVEVLVGTANYTYNYEQYQKPGNYVIAVSGLKARNYDIVYTVGTLTVNKAVDYQIELGNLTQRKGSVTPVTAAITPSDTTAVIAVEYQMTDGSWQTEVPQEIGVYNVRAYLVNSENIAISTAAIYTEAVLTIKAGAMIVVDGDTGVDINIDTKDESVEILVDDDALQEVIDKIPSTGEVVIDVTGNGESKELILPSNLVGALDENTAAKDVTVIADDAEISISSEALKTMADSMETHDKVGISIAAVEKGNLSKEQQQALNAIAKDAVVLELNMVVSKYDADGNKLNEEKLHEFNGKVNVRAAYTLPEEMQGKRVIVCYVSDNGTVTYIRAEYSDGHVQFVTDHFSEFAIMTIGGEEGVNASFSQTEEQWHFNHISVNGASGSVDEATVYVAIYNADDVLLTAKTAAYSVNSEEGISVEKVAGATDAMVYVWENGTMKPVTDKPKHFDLTQQPQ